ncbi:hypothetical protein KP509_05G102900 [Ceratopteris richardii]|uniref:Uncharacterized protein n=1 Tax=Ceratopteris richardii TaxID=49495 RepID=A0A8T2UWV3_CERRI|nr:hypothetical protein KP509_05G102900 [Ceratopteris richardii]
MFFVCAFLLVSCYLYAYQEIQTSLLQHAKGIEMVNYGRGDEVTMQQNEPTLLRMKVSLPSSRVSSTITDLTSGPTATLSPWKTEITSDNAPFSPAIDVVENATLKLEADSINNDAGARHERMHFRRDVKMLRLYMHRFLLNRGHAHLVTDNAKSILRHLIHWRNHTSKAWLTVNYPAVSWSLEKTSCQWAQMKLRR